MTTEEYKNRLIDMSKDLMNMHSFDNIGKEEQRLMNLFKEGVPIDQLTEMYGVNVSRNSYRYKHNDAVFRKYCIDFFNLRKTSKDLKSINRIYSPLDPYGEENWTN